MEGCFKKWYDRSLYEFRSLLTAKATDFIEACLRVKVENRLSAETALQHPWIDAPLTKTGIAREGYRSVAGELEAANFRSERDMGRRRAIIDEKTRRIDAQPQQYIPSVIGRERNRLADADKSEDPPIHERRPDQPARDMTDVQIDDVLQKSSFEGLEPHRQRTGRRERSRERGPGPRASYKNDIRREDRSWIYEPQRLPSALSSDEQATRRD